MVAFLTDTIIKPKSENLANSHRELPEKVTLKLPFSHQNSPKSNLFHPLSTLFPIL